MNAQWKMVRRSSTPPSSRLAAAGWSPHRIGCVTPLAVSPEQGLKRGLGHRFSDVRLHSQVSALGLQPDWSLSHDAMAHPPSGIQQKLEVASSNDPLEREAERAADQVMRMAEPTTALTSAPTQFSRKCAACEEEDMRARLQTKRAPSEPTGSTTPTSVQGVLRSPGQPLDDSTRAFMEQRFLHDFSRVRVHCDSDAAASARALNAQAYTLGNAIVFGQYKYSPNSHEGRHLLAHELAHVVQQNGANAAIPAARMNPDVQTLVAPCGADHAGIVFRSESVHPEEQHCQELSESGTNNCAALIECINDLILRLEIREHEFQGDPGHAQRFRIVQGILRALIALALAAGCEQQGYADEIESGREWGNKQLSRQQTPEEQRRTLRERLPSVPNWVWWALGAVALALIIACFASGACEVGAIIAALGEGIGWIIINALRLAGVGVLATASAASTPNPESGSEEPSAMA